MTPDRLLDIAIREFGAKGLDGASTRGIAAAAGTAMSAITYHYGGKEGLYLAAADRIAQLMAERVDGNLDGVAAVGDADAGGARAAIVRILLGMVDTMAAPESEPWTLFIVREQTHPTAAFERIYAGAMGRVLATLARLVGIATGVPAREACIAAVTLAGQVITLRNSRAMVLRLLDTGALSTEDLGAFKARIAANTDAILHRLRADTRDTP